MINRTDTGDEISLVNRLSLEAGADASVAADHWAKGGEGAVHLAQAVINQSSNNSFKFLYELQVIPLKQILIFISNDDVNNVILNNRCPCTIR